MFLRRTSANEAYPSLEIRNQQARADSLPFTRPIRLFIRNFRLAAESRQLPTPT